jgi:hypothetical protein
LERNVLRWWIALCLVSSIYQISVFCPSQPNAGISYFWKRITEDMWVPHQYSQLHDLLWDKTYPAQDALFRHLCNLSNGSTAISRCIDRYRQADPCSTEVTTDLMVVIAYLGACDYPYDNDHGRLKHDAEYDYEERIQRILAE